MRGVPWLRTALCSVCSPLQPFGPPMLAELACGTPCFIGLTSACFAHCARPSCASSIRNSRPAAPDGLQFSFAHWAYYGLFRALRAAFVRPHQFPLKSCGFSSAETARKRFLLWKMKFSATKIAPSPPYTPPGTIEARKGFTPLLGYSQSAPLYMSRALRALTKYRKNEA